MERYYQFAGVGFRILLPQDMAFSESESLARFRAEPMADAHEFRYRVVESLSEPGEPLLFNEGGFREYGTEDVRIRYLGNVKESWENGFIRAEHRGKIHEVQLKKVGFQDQIGSKRVLQALWPEHLIARSGGFVFHCFCIESNGRAIVFTAPSETGKSTQADLWNWHRSARIINGDRSAIRCTEEGIMACGIPYSGSSPYCENRTLPLACVVYLAQSPETGIRRLHGAEAFLRVWEGCSINTWDKEDMALVSGAVGRVVSSVPVYYLACSPDESAVQALEEALRKQEDHHD